VLQFQKWDTTRKAETCAASKSISTLKNNFHNSTILFFGTLPTCLSSEKLPRKVLQFQKWDTTRKAETCAASKSISTRENNFRNSTILFFGTLLTCLSSEKLLRKVLRYRKWYTTRKAETCTASKSISTQEHNFRNSTILLFENLPSTAAQLLFLINTASSQLFWPLIIKLLVGTTPFYIADQLLFVVIVIRTIDRQCFVSTPTAAAFQV
jgi:hypothetical protein